MILKSLHALLLLLAFSLPFEVIRPMLVTGGVRFTNLELLATACIVAWLTHLGARAARSTGTGIARVRSVWWKTGLGEEPAVWAAVFFVIATFASAALTPSHRLDALKFVTRVGTGVLVFCILVDTVRSGRLVGRLLGALVAGAGLSAAFALGEVFGWAPVVSLLPWLKEAPARIGGTLRVGGSFQYATMAAMYFEVAVLAAAAVVATARTAVGRGAAAAVAGTGAAIVVLTYSRAGIVTLGAMLAVVAVVGWRSRSARPIVRPVGLALAVLVVVSVGLARGTDAFRARLVTENDLGWYGATYAVPDSFEIEAGDTTEVTVLVRNTGAARWHATGANPFALGVYWLEGERPVGAGHLETPLPRSVEPGDSVRVRVELRPRLPPGRYRLVWGMLQHQILWFRHREVPEASTAVRISGDSAYAGPPPVYPNTAPGGRMPSQPVTVDRADLWRAAIGMWAERPLVGVGPDNFRHLYGEELGLVDSDERMHSNSLYLEILAGWGVFGVVAFVGVILAVWLRWWPLLRSASGDRLIRALALGAGFLAFLVHGLVDYFLGFTSHYLLFWLFAGFMVAISRYSETNPATESSSP